MISEIRTGWAYHFTFDKMKKIFIILYLIPIFIGCDSGGDAKLPVPGSVLMVPHAPDTSAVEQGIDAVPESDGVLLVWYGLNDPGVRYYDIYRQKENETYFRRIKRIDLDTAFPGADTVYTDNSADIQLNIYNYYYVKAVNRDDEEGSPSDTVRYKLIEKPATTRPSGELVQGMPVLYWNFPGVIPDEYIVRIEEEFTNRVALVRQFRVKEYFEEQSLDLGSIGNQPQLIPGFTYRWRIDSVGPQADESGSESQWRIFTAQ
jgi:hypothetical protein